jgi:hypothetical protein
MPEGQHRDGPVVFDEHDAREHRAVGADELDAGRGSGRLAKPVDRLFGGGAEVFQTAP